MSLDEFRSSLIFIQEQLEKFGIAGQKKFLTIQYVGGEILTVGTDYLRSLKNIADEVFSPIFKEIRQGVQSNLIGSAQKIDNLIDVFGKNIGTSYDNHTEQRTVKQSPQAYQKIFFTNIKYMKQVKGMVLPGIIVIDKKMYDHTLDELIIANRNRRHLTLRPAFQGGSPIDSISEAELSSLYKKIFPEWFMKMNIAVEPFFSLLSKRVSTRENDSRGLATSSGCPFQHNCATSSLNLNPNGDLYVCLDMADSKHYPLGNTLSKEFNAETFELLKNRSNKLNQDCLSCSYFKECQGGCMNEAIESTGEVYGKTHYCGTWKTTFKMIDEGIAQYGIKDVKKWIEKINSL